MEIKNGIIKDGMIHVLSSENKDHCKECLLRDECGDSIYMVCDIFDADIDECFVNRGKVTDIKIEEEKK